MNIVLNLEKEDALVIVEQLEDLLYEIGRSEYYVSRRGWDNEGVEELIWGSIIGPIKTVLTYEHDKYLEEGELG
jgi:hypothetical protein